MSHTGWGLKWTKPLLLLLSHFSCVRLYATHRRQPTRLPRPWDSPGKNTGVGCHFFLQSMKVKSESEPTPVFLPGESQGWQSLVGCRLWGRTESDTTKTT